mmetsp:Transcript_125581/g.355249  ORF Transcript_125581/g.355249 Transcript_125581/m.355249 type:complete len:298 (-) Transcript_125581:76-969(-)
MVGLGLGAREPRLVQARPVQDPAPLDVGVGDQAPVHHPPDIVREPQVDEVPPRVQLVVLAHEADVHDELVGLGVVAPQHVQVVLEGLRGPAGPQPGKVENQDAGVEYGRLPEPPLILVEVELWGLAVHVRLQAGALVRHRRERVLHVYPEQGGHVGGGDGVRVEPQGPGCRGQVLVEEQADEGLWYQEVVPPRELLAVAALDEFLDARPGRRLAHQHGGSAAGRLGQLMVEAIHNFRNPRHVGCGGVEVYEAPSGIREVLAHRQHAAQQAREVVGRARVHQVDCGQVTWRNALLGAP